MKARLILMLFFIVSFTCFAQNDTITKNINIYNAGTLVIINKEKSDEEKKNEKEERPINKCQIMYLNAVNFDFKDSKSGYAGHLNFFYTDGTRLGFNAGVLKINYSNNDSLSVNRTAYVKMKPLDELNPGDKYLRQFNEYKRKSTNSSLSLYFQPLLRLTDKDKDKGKGNDKDKDKDKDKTKTNSEQKSNTSIDTQNTEKPKSGIDAYLHLHAELLITKFETKTTISTIQQDTLTVAADEILPRPILATLEKDHTVSKTLLNGYLGGGVTFNFNLSDTSSMFFQPTFGLTTNYPQPASVNGSGYYSVQGKDSWNWFYLIRAHYRNKFTSGTELIIGSDIRGLLPEYPPYYSVYVGVNVSLDKFAEIFK